MMNRTPNIIFRCDGNSVIGLGHLYRCIALAAFLDKNYPIIFALRASSGKSHIPSAYRVIELREDLALAEEPAFLHNLVEFQNSILVLDGYAFDSGYVKEIHDYFATVYIDDLHSFKIHADLIINHAGGFTASDFHVPALTKLCLGPDYAILRSEFLVQRHHGWVYDVMICFGGADPQNHTARVLADFTGTEKIALVIGSAYAFRDSLKVPANTTVFENLDAANLSDVMASSQTAITSASTVAYEYLAVSKGNLFIVQTADNQKFLTKFLIEQGAARLYQGWLDQNWSSRNLIDGRSGTRLLNEFIELEKELYVAIRRVQPGDLEMVFEWINDPEVRLQSYNQQPVAMDDHRNWFNAKVSGQPCYYYIIHAEKGDMGQIRFTISGSEATLGFLVAPGYRGMGWGSVILKKGIKRLLADAPHVRQIIGYVKRSNPASQKSFLKCNFKEESTTDYPDSFRYTLDI
jgi:UDP-2,4-diacetamido-2,4,6-trideoxy-beta-L-altropyranose hydrolase